ncbi:hypothetical protein [Yoonia sp.]
MLWIKGVVNADVAAAIRRLQLRELQWTGRACILPATIAGNALQQAKNG